MTEHELPGAADDVPPPPAASAGVLLAQAREASRLSIDDVAAQLKLAPRQVVAIERDDFAALPGRTFVRGFVRNYARLLKLDVDAVLAALPGDGASPAPDRPLAATASRSIGEMPREPGPRAGVARWAIPLVLVAIVAVAAFYEFARPPAPPRAPASLPADPSTTPAASPPPPPAASVSTPPEPAGASRPPEATGPGAAPAPSSSELPNPLANAAPATNPASVPAPAAPAPDAAPASPPGPATSSGAARHQLALAFRGTSWLEVRDRSGNVVLSMTGTGGTTRELPVVPPGEVIIGNAAVVDASWRGRAIDLAPYTKQNVARVRLD